MIPPTVFILLLIILCVVFGLYKWFNAIIKIIQNENNTLVTKFENKFLSKKKK